MKGRGACPWPQFPVSARKRCFGFRVSGFGFRVSGSGFRVPGSGFRVPGLGFRVSGFGFRASVFDIYIESWMSTRREARFRPWKSATPIPEHNTLI